MVILKYDGAGVAGGREGCKSRPGYRSGNRAKDPTAGTLGAVLDTHGRLELVKPISG